MSDYDITGKIGPDKKRFDDEAEWPMYSFASPAFAVWNAIGENLHKRGWSEAKIKEWLQSKEARWAMDRALGDALIAAADKYATEKIK